MRVVAKYAGRVRDPKGARALLEDIRDKMTVTAKLALEAIDEEERVAFNNATWALREAGGMVQSRLMEG